MSTETAISLILFLGALLLVWRTRKGLFQERERAQTPDTGPETARKPAVETPPGPVADLETTPPDTTPTIENQREKPENPATEKTTGKGSGKPAAKITEKTFSAPEKKAGVELDQKTAVKPGPAPESIGVSVWEPVGKTAGEGPGKPGRAAVAEPKRETENGMGREETPFKHPGMATGKKSGLGAAAGMPIERIGGSATDPTIKMPPDGDSPPEVIKPMVRPPPPRAMKTVSEPAPESVPGPRSRAAGPPPPPYDMKSAVVDSTAINSAGVKTTAMKNSAGKTLASKNPAEKKPPEKKPVGETP